MFLEYYLSKDNSGKEKMMPIIYKLNITDPKTHLVQVKMEIPLPKDKSKIKAYFSSNRINVVRFSACQEKGRILSHKIGKELDYHIELEKEQKVLQIEYTILANTIKPFCAWVITEFAHLPHEQVFLAIEGMENIECEVFFNFYQGWSKLNCGLNDISKKRDVFHYRANNIDEVFRATTEIGCYESDGFALDNIEHHLLYQGSFMDTEAILKLKAKEVFQFLYCFCPKLAFSKLKIFSLLNDNYHGSYVYPESVVIFQKSLSFRQENGSNIWATDLGKSAIEIILRHQFGLDNKNWWSLGLREYLGIKLALKLGLISEKKYLQKIQKIIEKYQSNPGKKFQSLEEAIYLNGEDQNYYLDLKSKATLYCFLADILLFQNGADLFEILGESSPKNFLKKRLPKKTFDDFELLYSTCEEINLNTYLGRVGMELGVSEKNNLNTGLSFKVQDNRVFIDKVLLDSDAYKAGLYVGDEILAIDGIRFLPSDLKTFENLKSCERLLISRFGNISQVELHVKNSKKLTQLYLREKGEFIQANA